MNLRVRTPHSSPSPDPGSADRGTESEVVSKENQLNVHKLSCCWPLVRLTPTEEFCENSGGECTHLRDKEA